MASPAAILVQLQIATEKFVSDLNKALTTSLGLTTNWSKQVQQSTAQALNPAQIEAWTAALNKLNLYLNVNEKQFASTTTSVKGFALATLDALVKGGHEYDTALLSMRDNMVEYGVSLRQAGILAIEFGQATINGVNGVLDVNRKLPLSFKETSDAIGEASVKFQELINNASQLVPVEKEIESGSNGVANATKNAGNGFDYLANRIKSVVVSLLIVQTIYQVIQAFKDLTTASQQLAQTQYELSANVEYANKVLGPQIGNLKEWQAEIERLSTVLKVFSKQDITESVSKTIELTGQLGFTKDQMSSLIEVAAHLAERTGKSLIDTITELGNAIGGGRLQGLHDLGLYIRTTDLATESWTEGLGKNINGLSDQERALVALNVVLKKSNDLISTTGDYLDTTAGQMKAADTSADNSTKVISKSLEGLNLILKNIWADFLGYVSDGISKFKLLDDFITQFNLKHSLANSIGKPPELGDVGLAPFGDLGKTSNGPDAKINNAIAIGDLKTLANLLNDPKIQTFFGGATQNQFQTLFNLAEIYAKKLQDVKDKQNEVFRLSEHDNSPVAGSTSSSGTNTDLSGIEITAVDSTTKKVEALFDKSKKDLDKAQLDYMDSISKAYENKIKANIAALEKYNDNLSKINQNFAHKSIDETTKYHRELATLETEEGYKEVDAADVRDKKIIDNKKKYYDALRALDEQFYFSIFDAVANNDAIAIFAAERKYNMDKDKLKQNYKDQNQAANENYQDTIEKIQKDTERRRELLQERYNQQNQDYAIQRQREIDANAKAFKEDIAVNQSHYEQETIALKAKWEEQKNLIITNTADAYAQLISDLKTALTAHQDYWTGLIDGWTKYYTDLEKMALYYKDVPGAPTYAPPTNPPPTNQTTQCPPGQVWSDKYKACVPNEIGVSGPSITTSSGTGITAVKTHKLTIGSDGTISDAILNSVIKEVADTIQTMVVERGG